MRRALAAILLAAPPAPFAFTVDTTKAGSSSTQFVLPLNNAWTYNFAVDWGDGTSSVVTTNTDITHTYAASGTYTVKIRENVIGGFAGLYFNAGGDCLKMMAVTQWGSITWRTMSGAFNGCANLTLPASDAALAKTAAVTDWNQAFFGCTALTGFPLLDTSGATSMVQTWYNCTGLTSFPALNTANVIDFSTTWFGCSGLTSFPTINVSKGTTFTATWRGGGYTSFPALSFDAATSLAQAWYETPLASFPLITNTSHVTNWSQAFYHMANLASFPALDTSGGVNFSQMFAFAGALWDYDFPRLDWHNATDLTNIFQNFHIAKSAYNLILDLLANGNGGSIPKNTNTGVVFGAGDTHYDGAGIPARALLVTTRSWTITDGGTP